VTSFFGGGGRGHSDPGLTDANRRQRLRIARDLGDEDTLARDGEPRIQRSRHWLWFGFAAAALVALPLIQRGSSPDVSLATSCTTPALATSSSSAQAGATFGYRVTGPQDARYVVTLDGRPVSGEGTISPTITPAGPAITLQACLSPTLLTPAPAGDGPHTLTLLSVAPDDSFRQVAATTLTVTGTP
jgi:hypothetical protein